MMKRLFFLLFTICILQNVEAQRFVGSVIFGGNGSQIDGDEVAGYKKFGFNVGGSFMITLDKKQRFFTTIELLYNQKGSYQRNSVNYPIRDIDSTDLWKIDYNTPQNTRIKYYNRLDYVEIPVLFHYEDPKSGWAFGAGFSYARLVYVREIENGFKLKSVVQAPDFWYNRNDWSIMGDVKIRLYKGLKLNVRFQYSLAPIRYRTFHTPGTDGLPLPGKDWERRQYNNVISVRLIYAINEKYVPNPKYAEAKRNGKRLTKWVRDNDAIIYK
jgi:hypothetical protein